LISRIRISNPAGAENILIVCVKHNAHDRLDRSFDLRSVLGTALARPVDTKGDGLLSIRLGTSSAKDVLYCKQTTGNSPYESNPVSAGAMHMNGQDVYKFAVSVSLEDLKSVIEQAGFQPEDIKYFLLHQANLRILESVRQRFDQPKEKFPTNLEGRQYLVGQLPICRRVECAALLKRVTACHARSGRDW
jgi:3-oxoacyl-[acyl-carrier-protein] synthase III